MRFVSTAGQAPAVDFATALREGLAPDGGLYLPDALPSYPERFFRELRPDMAAIGTELLRPFHDGIPDHAAAQLIREAFDFDVPLMRLEEDLYVLELFHGPTLAFKDVAARLLARLLGWLCRREDRLLTVLVATSGDTGSAVAQAFHRVPGSRVVVLYPAGRVSSLQEKLFATLTGNVRSLAVDGSFDDCQRLARAALQDTELRARVLLTSANSINVGRLLPQMTYYAHGFAQLPPAAPPVVFAVPSGNFGNLTAGLLVHRMGLPVARFVAGNNVNDAVTRYLENGVFAPRPAVLTISNAMDVGDPSNFARVQALYGGDLGALRRDVLASRHDDTETRHAIRDVYRRTGYLFDPHTAVAYLALRRAFDREPGDRTGVVLATAHPVKFREEIEPLIGRAIPMPERLARFLEQPVCSRPMAADLGALRSFLLAWDS